MKTLTLFFLLITSFSWSCEDLELLVSEEAIAQKIHEAAIQLNQEYGEEELTVVMVMKGAVCAVADLIRKLDMPVTLQYIKASSYGSNGTTAGTLAIKGIEDLNLANRHVLIVDDIFDSGKTMTALVAKLQELQPKTLRTLVVLAKDVARETKYLPDYVLFTIKNRFVVGYGLDYKEHYRNLPGIYAFINDTPPALP